MKANRKFLVFIAITLLCSMGVRGQTHLPPIAQNDSTSVIQPFADTINVTSNDSSPTGDSFCVTSVYGSPFFHVLNCNSIIFKSDSSSFGRDTAYYVVCNDSQPGLCDTAMVVVNVQRHYMPFMLNNSRWTVYTQYGDCQNDDIYDVQWNYYWTTIDTNINNLLYKNLYAKQDGGTYLCSYGTCNCAIGSPYLFGYLRQDTIGKKVFFLNVDSTYERVIYDFNIAVNDTVYKGAEDTSWVGSFNYYESQGNYYRQVNVQNYIEYLGWGLSVPNGWIEGFGSTAGLFNPYGVYTELLCFSSNGVSIYPNYASDTCAYIPVSIETVPELETSIHPNPTTGQCTLHLKVNNECLNASIFDMTGREVLPLFTNQYGSTFNFNVSTLANGLYFVKVSGSNGHVGVSKLIKE